MTAAATIRHPIQRSLDGDFSTIEILDALSSVEPRHRALRRADTVVEALAGRIWRLTESAAKTPTMSGLSTPPIAGASDSGELVSAADLKLLHAFETSALWRTPVADSTATLTPAVARAWMTIAEHWLAIYTDTADLRFVNTACKLLGVVWIHFVAATDTEPEPWRDPGLACQVATVAYLVHAATRRLADHLDARLIAPCPPGHRIDLTVPNAEHHRLRTPPRVMILAGKGSAGALRLINAATDAGLPIAHVCWYGSQPDPAAAKRASAYANAWYPPEVHHPTTVGDEHLVHNQTGAVDWDAVAETIDQVKPDLVFLVGMPIVPADILDLAPLGFVNAHNGALPHYRGMDAVGWAILNNDPITCSVHMARPAADSGEVLATAPVPLTPLETLRPRVRDTQLALLLHVIHHVTSTGELPAQVPQEDDRSRLHYRLHPHLKRMLDASPYGLPNGEQS